MKAPNCHYDHDLGWLTPEHRRDCNEHDCVGCRPCPKTHCGMRDRCATHVNPEAGLYTCPSCIGRTRKDIATIADLYALVPLLVDHRGADVGPLLEEAADAGLESEAFNLIGPAAAPEQWSERRVRLVAQYERRGWCDWPRHEGLAADDPHHPYAVLGRWDMAMRETYGPQTDLFVTVTSSAEYLTRLLDGGFAHTQEFEDFASEIAACRSHLEEVTHDARKAEEGRQCPRCTEDHGHGPRLRKRYAQHPGLKAGEQCQLPPRSEQHRDGCRTCAGDDDTWHCPNVAEHWWSERDYRDRVATDYVKHAAELPASELAERIGVPLSQVRKWAAKVWDDDARAYREPLLVSRRKSADGRKVYPVARALQLAEAAMRVGA